MSDFQMRTTIKGGLPVLLDCVVHPSDPAVGIMSAYVDEFKICWLSGKEVSDKVYNSIPKSDLERLDKEVEQGRIEAEHNDYIDYDDYNY